MAAGARLLLLEAWPLARLGRVRRLRALGSAGGGHLAMPLRRVGTRTSTATLKYRSDRGHSQSTSTRTMAHEQPRVEQNLAAPQAEPTVPPRRRFLFMGGHPSDRSRIVMATEPLTPEAWQRAQEQAGVGAPPAPAVEPAPAAPEVQASLCERRAAARRECWARRRAAGDAPQVRGVARHVHVPLALPAGGTTGHCRQGSYNRPLLRPLCTLRADPQVAGARRVWRQRVSCGSARA